MIGFESFCQNWDQQRAFPIFPLAEYFCSVAITRIWLRPRSHDRGYLPWSWLVDFRLTADRCAWGLAASSLQLHFLAPFLIILSSNPHLLILSTLCRQRVNISASNHKYVPFIHSNQGNVHECWGRMSGKITAHQHAQRKVFVCPQATLPLTMRHNHLCLKVHNDFNFSRNHK